MSAGGGVLFVFLQNVAHKFWTVCLLVCVCMGVYMCTSLCAHVCLCVCRGKVKSGQHEWD